MKIIWDEPKRLTTLEERGMDFATLTVEFFAASQIEGTRDGRFKAVGFCGEDLIAVIFKPLGSEALSVISMRRASRKERRIYKDRA